MSSPSLPDASLRASTLHLPAGPWSTVLDCLCARFPAIDRDTWLARMQRGRVLDAEGRALGPQAAYREGLRVHYFRELPAEAPIPFEARILYRDEHLLVADKPHFLPVMPAGGYVEQTLLARLARSTGNRDLVPLHRIDRHTAGLVLFSTNPGSRGRYQALFRERRIDKYYEAIAPALPRLDFPLLRRTRLVPGESFFRMREGEGEPNSETRIEVAERNGLKLGDTVTGIYYPENDTPAVGMEIVGIFYVAADKEDRADMYDDSSYYAYSSYVFCSMDAAEGLIEGWGEEGEGISEAYYYVADAAELDSVIARVQGIPSIDWGNFKITANDEVYRNVSAALSDTGTLVSAMCALVTVVGAVMVTLVLAMSVRGRKREAGIMMAAGIEKPSLAFQYALESLLAAAAAFPLAYLASSRFAGALGAVLGKSAEAVVVTPEHFALVAAGGTIILVAAIAASFLPIARLSPSQVLSQTD